MSAVPEHQPALSEEDQRVAVHPDTITAQYQQALADETQRRIVAEAMVQQLVRERADLRAALTELQAAQPEEGPQ